MTRNRAIAVRTVPSHCEEISCKKCRARCRWYRRKSWHANKGNRKPGGRK
jgi:hypothetical protein